MDCVVFKVSLLRRGFNLSSGINNVTANSCIWFLEVMSFFSQLQTKGNHKRENYCFTRCSENCLTQVPGGNLCRRHTVIKSVKVMQYCSDTCTCKLIRLLWLIDWLIYHPWKSRLHLFHWHFVLLLLCCCALACVYICLLAACLWEDFPQGEPGSIRENKQKVCIPCRWSRDRFWSIAASPGRAISKQCHA